MRLYTFINAYLSQIQQGIQTAHILGELINSHRTRAQDEFLGDWIQNHKTIIVCNGGNAQSIRDLTEFFKNKKNPYQFATFHEDGDSLDGALTGVGIILPETIYDVYWDRDAEAYVQELENGDLVYIRETAGFFFELIKQIKSFRLA